jgi:hypothetical protein
VQGIYGLLIGAYQPLVAEAAGVAGCDLVESFDAEAGRLGVARQAVIKVWIAERCAALRLVAQK